MKPSIEVVNDLLSRGFQRFFQVAEDRGLTLPWVVEVTDAEGDCVCRMAFDADMNGTADKRVVTHKNAPFPFTVMLMDCRGKRVEASVREPVPCEPQGGVN